MNPKKYLSDLGYNVDAIVHPQDYNQIQSEINLFELMEKYAQLRLNEQEHKINHYKNLSDELFELGYNAMEGLAHDELYEIVEKYEDEAKSW